MSEEVNNEQTKGAKQEEVPELTDDQLDEVAGGGAISGGKAAKASQTMESPPIVDGERLDAVGDEGRGYILQRNESDLACRIECYG